MTYVAWPRAKCRPSQSFLAAACYFSPQGSDVPRVVEQGGDGRQGFPLPACPALCGGWGAQDPQPQQEIRACPTELGGGIDRQDSTTPAHGPLSHRTVLARQKISDKGKMSTCHCFSPTTIGAFSYGSQHIPLCLDHVESAFLLWLR